MNFSLLITQCIFEHLKYHLLTLFNFLLVNKYYNSLLKHGSIWKGAYKYRYGEMAYLLESSSPTNLKDYPKKRKTVKRYPPIEEDDEKNWYQTLQSVMGFHRSKWEFMDIGSDDIKMKSTFYSCMTRTVLPYDNPSYYKVDSLDQVLNDFMKMRRSNVYLMVAVSPMVYDCLLRRKMFSTTMWRLLQTPEGKVASLIHSSVHYKNEGLCALQSKGMLSGVVVVVGNTETFVVSFLRGVQSDKISTYSLNGKTIQNKTQNKQWIRTLSVDEEHVDLSSALLDLDSGHLTTSPILELYFKPLSSIGHESLVPPLKKYSGGLMQMVHEYIESAKVPASSRHLLNNIVLTGCLTSVQGFTARFAKEMDKLNKNYTVHQCTPLSILDGMRIDSAQTQSYHDIYQL